MIEGAAEARDSGEAALVESLQLLNRPFTPDLQPREVVRVIDNKVRGRVDEGEIKFVDLTSRKRFKLIRIANSARRGTEEALDVLWSITVSDNPGQDVIWEALSLLDDLPTIPQGFREKLETLWRDAPDFKIASFAARIIDSHGGVAGGLSLDEERRFQELVESSCCWCPGLAEQKIEAAIQSLVGDEQTYASLVLYRHLGEEQSQRDHRPRLDETIEQGLAEATRRIDLARKKFERFKLTRSLVTLGTELQGSKARNVPIVAEARGCLYSSLSPFDYKKVARIGNLFPSQDSLWESALPPSDDPTIQALIIQELHKLGLISTEEESISFHITVGGLKSSTKHRGAAALQLIMLASDRVTDPVRLGRRFAKQEWFLRRCDKTALRERFWFELGKTGKTDETKVAAEMRVTSLTNLPGAYRTLLTLSILAAAAKDYQNKIDHQPFSPDLADCWESLVGEIDEIFSGFDLPSVVKIWNFRELERLKDLLESDRRESFSRKIRTVLGKYRLKITPVLEREEVPLERIEEESLGGLSICPLGHKGRKLLQPHRPIEKY